MRRRLIGPLLWMLIALGLGIGFAADEPETTEPPPPNRTLTCSTSLHRGACFIEQTVFSLGPFELAVGVDASLAYQAPTFAEGATVGGYVLAGWYAPTWGVWAELHAPRIAPVIGSPDWLRVGFTLRF